MHQRIWVGQHCVEDRRYMSTSATTLTAICGSMVDIETEFEHSASVVVERLHAKNVVRVDVSGVNPACRRPDCSEIAHRRSVHVEHDVERLSGSGAGQRIAEQREEAAQDFLMERGKGVIVGDRDLQGKEFDQRTDDDF